VSIESRAKFLEIFRQKIKEIMFWENNMIDCRGSRKRAVSKAQGAFLRAVFEGCLCKLPFLDLPFYSLDGWLVLSMNNSLKITWILVYLADKPKKRVAISMKCCRTAHRRDPVLPTFQKTPSLNLNFRIHAAFRVKYYETSFIK
jgi:hypothetical protein